MRSPQTPPTMCEIFDSGEKGTGSEQLASFPSKATQVAGGKLEAAGAPSTVNAPGTRVFVLRALLTNAPNSCPPERLFSMFNATFGEDQKSAFGDYLELAMQSQYNKRNL